MKLLTLSQIVDNLKEGTDLNDCLECVSHLQALFHAKSILDQPLTLGMFIPCKDGKPLEKPIGKQPKANIWKPYHEAQKRVLFEGFEVNFKSEIDFILSNGQYEIGFYKVKEGVIVKILEDGQIMSAIKSPKTISDLANATQDNPIKLKQHED